MGGYWIFPTITFAIILNFILSQQLLLIFVLGFWIVRIYFLHNRLISVWSLTFAIIAIFFGVYTQRIDQKIIIPESKVIVVDPNTVKVNGDLVQMRGNAQHVPVLVTAKLSSAEQKKEIARNTHWFKLKIEGDYEQIDPPHNIAEFNYQQFEHRQKHCDATIFLKKFSPQLIKENWWQKILSYKRKISLYFESFPKYSRFFFKMMIDDYEDLISKDDLSRLGLLSLFSLSGLQLHLWLTTWQKLGARLRITVEWVKCFSLLFLLIIIFFHWGKIGLNRSAIFLFVSQFMTLFKRKFSGLDIWAFTFFGFLLIRPYLLFSLGGSLCILITFFMQTKKREGRIITSIKINLLMLPVIFQQVFVWNIMSLGTNFLFFPIVSFLFPVFCLNMIFHFPLFDEFINFIYWILYCTLTRLTEFKSLDLVFGQIPIWASLILVILGLLILSKKGWQWRKINGLLTLYLLLFIGIHFPFSGRVIMIDIGQGDSFLIETPFHRQVILVDTGGKLKFNNTGWHERKSKALVNTVTLNYLHSRGINHLDAVITTHQDADHIGDLPELIKHIRIDRLIYGDGIMANSHYRKKVLPLKKTTHFIPVLAGKVVDVKGLKLKILNPIEPGLGENTDSVTFLAHIGQLDFLFTGDLDIEGEKRILQKYSVKADVLKVGHHGSKTSTSPEFLQAVKPKIAWISVGRKNRYGHPSPEVLKEFEKEKIPWFATKDVGMVYYEYNPLRNELKSFVKNGSK